jgi:hypothetical protein
MPMELPDRLRGRARPKAGLEQVGKAFLTPAVLQEPVLCARQ